MSPVAGTPHLVIDEHQILLPPLTPDPLQQLLVETKKVKVQN